MKLEEKQRQAGQLELERMRLEAIRLQREREEEQRMQVMVQEAEHEMEEGASTDLYSGAPVEGDRSEEDRLTHGQKDSTQRTQLLVMWMTYNHSDTSEALILSGSQEGCK